MSPEEFRTRFAAEADLRERRQAVARALALLLWAGGAFLARLIRRST